MDHCAILTGLLHGDDQTLQDSSHVRLGVDEVEVVFQRGGHFLVVVAVDLAEALGHAVAEAYGLHTLKAEAALFRHRTDGHFVEVFFGNFVRCHLQNLLPGRQLQRMQPSAWQSPYRG